MVLGTMARIRIRRKVVAMAQVVVPLALDIVASYIDRMG